MIDPTKKTTLCLDMNLRPLLKYFNEVVPTLFSYHNYSWLNRVHSFSFYKELAKLLFVKEDQYYN